ncbi:MAG: hypothetical protein GX202_08585, partial [Firmicutes bacterium]|nr:hypothetical protein [Bacillota bacterium]
MWKRTRRYVFLFLLLVFSVQLFPLSAAPSTGFLPDYETFFSQLLTNRALKPSPAIPPRVEPAPEPEPPFARVTPAPMPEEVRGIYATGWVAGTPSLFQSLLRFFDATPVNSLVVDIKDDTGKLSYRSAVPMVNLLGAWENKIADAQKMLQTLQQKKVYPIARLVVFKDPYLAEKRPDLALKQPNGEVWRDYKGLAWVDPHAREVWDYNIQIAKEAVKMGFPEIQFDYVRFASDGNLRNCVYPYADGSSKEDVIREFLLYARAELEPLGAVVSADIFGLVCSAADDLFIGQKLEKIAEAVPVISPMVYPSHYAKGSYGLADPDRRPYETVLRSLEDARRRLKDYPVKLRPWLQDFSLGNTYGPAQIQAQIRAVYDAGVREWLFWNPSCRYNATKYVTNTDQAAAWPGEPAGGDPADQADATANGEGAFHPPVVLGVTADWDEPEETGIEDREAPAETGETIEGEASGAAGETEGPEAPEGPVELPERAEPAE